MKTVQTEIPEELYKEAEFLIKEGWFRDEGELFSEGHRRAINRYWEIGKRRMNIDYVPEPQREKVEEFFESLQLKERA